MSESEAHSVRASRQDWEHWELASRLKNVPRNRWIRQSLNERAQLDLLVREQDRKFTEPPERVETPEPRRVERSVATPSPFRDSRESAGQWLCGRCRKVVSGSVCLRCNSTRS